VILKGCISFQTKRNCQFSPL